MVFTAIGLIGSEEPTGDRDFGVATCGASIGAAAIAGGGAGTGVDDVLDSAYVLAGAAAWTACAARARGVGSVASATAVTVRCVDASAMCASISSRMRASRAPAELPPRTTATMCRLLRRTEVTRLKPDAFV